MTLKFLFVFLGLFIFVVIHFFVIISFYSSQTVKHFLFKKIQGFLAKFFELRKSWNAVDNHPTNWFLCGAKIFTEWFVFFLSWIWPDPWYPRGVRSEFGCFV